MEIHCAEMQELKEETVESGGKFDDVNLVHLIYDCDIHFQKMLERRYFSLDSLPQIEKEKCSICLAREAEDDRAIEELEECVYTMSTSYLMTLEWDGKMTCESKLICFRALLRRLSFAPVNNQFKKSIERSWLVLEGGMLQKLVYQANCSVWGGLETFCCYPDQFI